MYCKLLHILGDLCHTLRFIAYRSGRVIGNRDPNGFAGLYRNAFRLDRGLTGIDNDVLHKAWNISVIPAIIQRLKLLARPCLKSVCAIIRPGPTAGSVPAFRYGYANRNHLVAHLFFRKGNRIKRGNAQRNSKKNGQYLFHLTFLHIFCPNITIGHFYYNSRQKCCKSFSVKLFSVLKLACLPRYCRFYL